MNRPPNLDFLVFSLKIFRHCQEPPDIAEEMGKLILTFGTGEADTRTSGRFYVAVVQSVLIFTL